MTESLADFDGTKIEFRYQCRRGIASLWTAKNTMLLSGEPGYETDTGRFKIGDGVNAWNDLPYFVNVSEQTFVWQPGDPVPAAPSVGARYIFNLATTDVLPAWAPAGSIVIRH